MRWTALTTKRVPAISTITLFYETVRACLNHPQILYQICMQMPNSKRNQISNIIAFPLQNNNQVNRWLTDVQTDVLTYQQPSRDDRWLRLSCTGCYPPPLYMLKQQRESSWLPGRMSPECPASEQASKEWWIADNLDYGVVCSWVTLICTM